MRGHLIVGLVLLSLAGCVTVTSFNHSPAMAARQAEKFAQVAFIERDYQKAYEMLSEGGKNYVSFEKFKEGIASMHPALYPSTVKAIEWEEMPGRKAITIYLYGENGAERFYYKFVMEGVEETDYLTSGFGRNRNPYPPSNMKQPLK